LTLLAEAKTHIHSYTVTWRIGKGHWSLQDEDEEEMKGEDAKKE
jgi:hypothetical protein